MKLPIVVALALATGCGKPVCMKKVGTWSASYTALDGTCGVIPTQRVQFDDQRAEVTAPCTGSITVSDDSCEIVTVSTCTLHDGSFMDTHEVATWDADGAQGVAVAEISIYGATRCSGTYDVKYSLP